MPYALLVGALLLLLSGAISFTNAVEWAGLRLGLGVGAVGSILAAVATALPESVIPIIAIISGDEAGEIAIGAILGAPFLLATWAMLVLAIAVRGFARRRTQGTRLEVHPPTTTRDLLVTMSFLSIALVLGLVGTHTVRVIAAVGFVAGYGIYLWQTVRRGGESGEQPRRLYFDPTKNDPPPNWAIIAQCVVGVAAIVGGAQLFVTQIEHLAEEAGVSALTLALIVAPLATELPEKFNSVLWSSRGKDALAVGNITGAMVFQSTMPVAVGLAFTQWAFTPISAVAVACALVGSGLALLMIRRRRLPLPAMLAWAVLYGGFVAFAIVFG